jgi:hypothetical protein
MSHEVILMQQLCGDAHAAPAGGSELGLVFPAPFYSGRENPCPMVMSEMKHIRDAPERKVPVWDRIILVSFDSKMTRLRCPIASATGSAWEMTACYLTASRLVCGNWLCFVA